MHNLFKHTARKYFRRERGMSYDERGPEVKGPWRATSFVEAEIELGFHADTSALPSHNAAVIRDAFLEGRFADVRTIAAQHGLSLCFTITGAYGPVCSERDAKWQAYEYTLSSLEDTEIAHWNEQWGTNFRSYASTARYVISTDGKYAGLGVYDTEHRTIRRFDKQGICVKTRGEERVLITEGCGCVHDTIADCFPEFATLIPWHLNTMRKSPDGGAWLVEELPDSVLETVRALVLADDNAKASERAA